MSSESLNPYQRRLGRDRVPADVYELLGPPSDHCDPNRPGAAAGEADPMAPVDAAAIDDLTALEEAPPPANFHRTNDNGRDAIAAGPPPIEVRSVPGRPTVARRQRRTQRGNMRWVYALVAICFLAVFACFSLMITGHVLPQREQRQRAQASVPQAAGDLPLPRVAEPEHFVPEVPSPAPVGGDPTQPPMLPAPSNDNPMSPSKVDTPATADRKPATDEQVPAAVPAASLTADQEAQVADLLRRVWTELGAGRIDRAKATIEQTEQLVGEIAPHAERVARLATLADYVDQFWQAVDEEITRIEGTELVLDRTRVFVVAVRDQEIVLRAAGKNRTFSRDKLPSSVALAIARRWFDSDAPTTRVFLGAMMAVSTRFSHDQVRREWQAAADSGTDLGDLPLVLDDFQRLKR
jgi:hypothetical protein